MKLLCSAYPVCLVLMVVSCQAGLPQGIALNSDCIRVLSRFSVGGICLVLIFLKSLEY